MSYNYPNSNVFIPSDEGGIPNCPKCGGETKDDGECNQGCCDYRKCLNPVCGYRYLVEWPD
jgi:hypothetical protein